METKKEMEFEIRWGDGNEYYLRLSPTNPKFSSKDKVANLELKATAESENYYIENKDLSAEEIKSLIAALQRYI